LECGDSSPLSIAAEPLFVGLKSRPYRQNESGFTAKQSGDESPHSKSGRLKTCSAFAAMPRDDSTPTQMKTRHHDESRSRRCESASTHFDGPRSQ
jgi:hypothetical protein